MMTEAFPNPRTDMDLKLKKLGFVFVGVLHSNPDCKYEYENKINLTHTNMENIMI